MKIRVKMLVSFGLVIAMVAALSVYAVIQVISVDSLNSHVIEMPLAREVAFLNFRAAMRELRFVTASTSAYAPTAEAERVRAYQRDAENAYGEGMRYLDEYVLLVENDPLYSSADVSVWVGKAQQAQEYFTQYKTEVFDRIAEAAMAGDHARTLEIINAGKEINDSLRAVNNELITDGAVKADQLNKDASAAAERTVIILAVIAAAVVLVSLLMAVIVSALISKPIIRLVDISQNVAKGNLNINIDTSLKDETGMLAKGFALVVKNIRGLIDDTSKMYELHENEGDIDARIDETLFEGAYRDMAAGINQMVASYIRLVEKIFEVLSAFGGGDFEQDLERQVGKKQRANEEINALRNRVNGVSDEIQLLVGACLQGNLSARGDVTKFRGTWRRLIQELNELVEAVVTPINESIGVMVEMSQGNLNANMTGSYKGDFLTIKNSLNTTVNEISSYIKEINKNLAAMADGDLRGGITREYAGDFVSIKDAINTILLALNKTTTEMNVSSEQVLIGAKQISETAMALAQGATEQAGTIEELTANMDTISNQMDNSAQNAKTAAALSVETAFNAEKGNGEMKQMLESMELIRTASGDISSIIKTIQDISFQTNLLALNASVEAARAGEYGRGFGVVAGEVRTLAQHSKKAADETTSLIESSIARVNEGTDIANNTAKSLEKIVENANSVSKIISEISEASAQQAEAAGQISIGINQISQVVQNNSSTSEESAAAAEELNSQAEMLRQMVSFFKTA